MQESSYIDRGEGAHYSAGAWKLGQHTHQALSTASSDVDQWVHVAGVYDGAAWRLYRNGRLAATEKTDLAALKSDASWTIGGPSDSKLPFYFHGEIDDVRIYNRALSAEEVAVLAK